MENGAKITLVTSALIVTIAAALYVIYYDSLRDLGMFAVMISPLFIFALAGTYKFKKNLRDIRLNLVDYHVTELTGSQALRHDLLTYFVPAGIIALTLFTQGTPTATDFFQAALVYLALVGLKIMYWRNF